MNGEKYEWSNGAFFIYNPWILTKSFKEIIKENRDSVMDLYKISLILSWNYVEWINKFRY